MTYICVQICVYIYRIHVYIYTATYTHRESVLLLLLSHFSRVRLCVTPQTAAHQASCPWDSPGKNTGVGCHFLLQCMKVKSESEVAQSCPTPSDPTDCSLPGSSIHGISRQEYSSGVPLPSPQGECTLRKIYKVSKTEQGYCIIMGKELILTVRSTGF